ncbi:MAG: hypothetical protein JO270_21625 [Acidobacteriaceae bacterium]|nr:hypothetical protein [Acidobacteriaceae bacterium]
MLRGSIVAAVFAAALLLVPGKSMAQNFVVDHYTSADQLYTFVENGATGANEFNITSFACANIYVYSFQDIVACGSCLVSPNGSLEEDLDADLINHPVTGVRPPTGVVKVVFTSWNQNFCDPTALGATSANLKAFRAKGTSELELFDNNVLSAAEEARLNSDCTAVFTVLSGAFNVTCGPTDAPPKGYKGNNPPGYRGH